MKKKEGQFSIRVNGGDETSLEDLTDKLQRWQPKQNVTIKKAAIKDFIFLDVTYYEQKEDRVSSNINESSTRKIHPDLIAAFARLSEHLAALTFQPLYNEEDVENPQGKIFDEPQTDKMPEMDVICTGFTIGGTGESEGVTLIGRRSLPNGKTLNLVSPFQKWMDDIYEYNEIHALSEVIEACKGEVKLYLGGKHAPEAQLAIDFTANAGEEDELLK